MTDQAPDESESPFHDEPPSILARVPPNDPDAEMALLGSVLLDGDMVDEVSSLVKAEDFYRSAHGKVWEVILAVRALGGPVDALLVVNQATAMGVLVEIGGREFIASLANAVPSAANAEHYAKIVREKAVARAAIRLATNLQRVAYETGNLTAEQLDGFDANLVDLREGQAKHMPSVRELLEEALRPCTEGDTTSRIPTNIRDLNDKIAGGLPRGGLVVVGGRPSMGKSSFALNVALSAAVDGASVAIFSLEVSAVQVTQSLLSIASGVPIENLMRGTLLSEQQADEISDAAKALKDCKRLLVDDNAGLTDAEIRSRSRALARKGGLDLVIVDYLQLVGSALDVKRHARYEVVGQMTRTFKNLAREINACVLVPCQLNRNSESGEGRRPTLADLRESGNIEQDADLVFLLYRPEKYARSEADKDKVKALAEVDVAKNRWGGTQRIRTAFLADRLTFRDLESWMPFPGDTL